MTEKIPADCTPVPPWTPVHDTLLTEPGVLRCKQTLVKPGNSELVSMAGGLFLLFPEYLTIVLECFIWLVLVF